MEEQQQGTTGRDAALLEVELPDGVDREQVGASKQEAKELELTYFYGSRCRKAGHPPVRYTSSQACVFCKRKSSAEKADPSVVSEEDTLRAMFHYALRTRWREQHHLPYCGYLTGEAWANGLSYEPENEDEEGSTLWWLIGSDGEWYQKEPYRRTNQAA